MRIKEKRKREKTFIIHFEIGVKEKRGDEEILEKSLRQGGAHLERRALKV
jgi:hypothetical protein